MAAVACSNNAHVTFELLSFILNDDETEEDGFTSARGFAAKSPGKTFVLIMMTFYFYGDTMGDICSS